MEEGTISSPNLINLDLGGGEDLGLGWHLALRVATRTSGKFLVGELSSRFLADVSANSAKTCSSSSTRSPTIRSLVDVLYTRAMFTAGTSRLASSSIPRACSGALALRKAATPGRAQARFFNSSGHSSTASSSSSSRIAVVAAGIVGGSALYLTLNGRSRTLELQGGSRPSYSERLTTRSKASSQKSASAEQEDKKALAGEPSNEVEASQGTGAFAASLSSTEAAPEAAEVVVEGSDASSGQAAFNPETGEINWDCPCLGGMAHGSCGEEFKAAFSCFVYSEKEPKGIECVDRFKAMQECFRKHPEEYAEEIADDDRAAAEEADEEEQASSSDGVKSNSD
ncbi:hypothetical protein A4X09_0g22 [Tilletia walkeri]|uniref:Mitochondrial intermembrane space import and assembly protein 40 n=1 Tax=Tilletia walkeri TaxID=117179 RepID=A0A8X7NDZ3_9BASI|nr:hypothetical protein A4X09_0g22 [Tilletia walkeri]